MKILINRSDAIGDTLLTLPVVDALRENFTEVEVGFVTSPRSKEIFSMHSGVDKIWVLEGSKRQKFKISRDIFRQWKPDVYVYLGGSHIPSYAAWRAGVPNRLGLLSRLFSFLYLNKGVRQKRSDSLHHESGYNLGVLTPLLKDLSSEVSRERARGHWVPQLKWTQEADDQALEYLKKQIENCGLNPGDFSRDWIVVHPGMTGHSLNWRMKHYAQWIVKMEETFPGRFLFILSYTQSDADYIESFKNQLEDLTKSCSLVYFDGGEVGLMGYTSLLDKASLFLGPSTGTTHIANIVRTPCIGLYSPIPAQSAERWGPLRKTRLTRVLTPSVECPGHKECLGQQCPEYYCMDQITVDKCIESAQRLLAE